MANDSLAQPELFSTCSVSLDFEPQPVATLPPTVVPIWILMSIINGLAAPLIVGINFLIIWTVLKDVRLRESSYNIAIAILACADMFVGLVIQPLFINLIFSLLFDVSHICPTIIAYIAGSLFCAWSLASLTVISVERYLAIEHPFFHEANVTVTKTVLVSLLGWAIMSSGLIGFRFISDGSFAVRQIPVAAVILTCCLPIIFCVGKVYHTARRQQRSIALQKEGLSQQEQDSERERTILRLKEMKRFFTLGLILFATVLLYLPSLVSKVIAVTLGKEFTPDFKYISQFIWGSCVYLQSLANPLIVSLRLSRIRQGVKRRLLCKLQ